MAGRVAEIRLAPKLSSGSELLDALAAFLEDQDVRVVLLDATGPLTVEAPLEASTLRDMVLFEIPLIIAFEGALAGAATDLALAADIRICSESAALQGPLRGNARVRTLVDEATALKLFLGRTSLPSADLLEAGLVSSVVASGQALQEARRLAEIIASRGPIATRLAKEAIWRGLPQPLNQALRFETDLTLLLQTTKDRAEGVRAFLEKRPPNFTGE